MGQKELNVHTRRSRLARCQTGEAIAAIRHLFPEYSFRVTELDTPGDRDLTTPLSDANVPDDFFTRDLDQALLDGCTDLAVHSAKDLPQNMPAGLTVAALLPACDIRDVLVFRPDWDPDGGSGTIGTSSPRREEFIRQVFRGVRTAPIRGTVDDRLAQLDAGDFEAVIVAACALERLGCAHRIGRYLPYDPTPHQGRLAIVIRADNEEMLRPLGRVDVRRTAGLVAIVGCPADASLLSVLAERYLHHADVVLHDRLLPDTTLLKIRGKAIPVGKAAGEKCIPQSEIHRLLLQEAEQGRLVCRLQGGDPGIFGHLAEQLEFLNAWDIRTDVLPAVTAAQTAAARARAPLTHRGSGKGVSFISARPAAGEELENLPGPDSGNLAIYMAVNRLETVSRRLLKSGWTKDTTVAVGERVGYPDEAVVYTDVEQLANLETRVPAVVLVGTRTFPAGGWTLFTGTDPAHFLKHGPILHWPLIRLVPRPAEERLAELDTHLDRVDGVIFPGRFAVRVFMESLLELSDARALAGKRLLAVGPATAEELAAFGLKADRAAESLGGVRALAGLLSDEDKGTFLYPCSDAAPQEARARALAPHGIEVVAAVFYGNRLMPRKIFPRLPFDRVIFTSTSTVNAYFDSYPDELKAVRTWVPVGPSTLEALEERGLTGELLGED